MSEKEKSVIRPGDIPVGTRHFRTVLSPDLAASILVDPLVMGVKPPYGSLADFKHLVALDNRKIKKLREKVDNLLKKYEGV